MAKKVAVIGAGASGLPAIKACLEEGMEPVCFEMDKSLGGLWRYTEDRSSHSSVYQSTVINTSKEMMCYSDFPIPKEYPPYMHNTYVVKYLELYAEKFDLLRYVRFNTVVENVQRAADFDQSGQWEIKFTEGKNGDQKTEIYDAVFVCTGHHWKPNFPEFNGLDKFKGTVMHSHFYKHFNEFVGKNVLVIGIGNSAGDIAVELSYHAKQVYLSTRSGAWILGRMGPNGTPVDLMYLNRFFMSFPKWLTSYIVKTELEKKFNHAKLGLQAEHDVTGQHPMINDILPHRIFSGQVIVKTDISHFTETGVVFKDDTQLEEVDAIIVCTGYDIGFPILQDRDVQVVNNEVNLYKYMFPPHHAHPTLAVIGTFQATGAHNPLVELQLRWGAQVFKGNKKLPSQQEMEAEIKHKRDAISKVFYASKRHTIQVDYIAYADELATLAGCRPNFFKLFLCDPVLAFRCYFGPCTPAQFRLFGPHQWSGAKRAIEMAHYNTEFPTKTRVLVPTKKKQSSLVSLLKWLIVPSILGILVMAFMK